MEDPETLAPCWSTSSSCRRSGCDPSSSTAAAKPSPSPWKKPGLKAQFVQGRRYTDEATLAIVARVLAEEINAYIVRHINEFGGRARACTTRRRQCLFGRRLTLPDGAAADRPRPVGEVTEVDARPIENLCLAGVVPVLPSLAEADGQAGHSQRQRRHRRRGRRRGPQGRETRLPHRYPRHPSPGGRTREPDPEPDPRRGPGPDRAPGPASRCRPGTCSGGISRIMMQPIAISGAVAKPNSSAPSMAAITMSRPVFSWPSVWTVTRLRRPFITSVCCVSARPISQGKPACWIELERRGARAAVVAGNQDLVRIPLGHPGGNRAHARLRTTSFTLDCAPRIGAACRSKISCARSSME